MDFSAMAMSSSDPDSSTSFLSVTSLLSSPSDPDADRDRPVGEPEPADLRPGEPDAADLLEAGDADREPDPDRGDLKVKDHDFKIKNEYLGRTVA